MTTRFKDSNEPDQTDIRAAHEALPHIKAFLARNPTGDAVKLIVAESGGKEELVVPRAAVEMLARILALMGAGKGVSIVPSHAELTTQQAADVLNVSRPFLIGLLTADEIEYRMVGTHRRVKMSSLMDYLRSDSEKRRNAADELTSLAQELGLD
ncbi:MAG: helix-turn-helix domain-containing protein [Candidatus Nanopelagicales bacterium]|nr:helix-turn-helix domain-containing protein [Candidatus Nanopelagicales bacterium]MDZ4250390.1 helix-turn-helix domain-containing protein [Candidatus Nanopelagicales bacterium]